MGVNDASEALETARRDLTKHLTEPSADAPDPPSGLAAVAEKRVELDATVAEKRVALDKAWRRRSATWAILFLIVLVVVAEIGGLATPHTGWTAARVALMIAAPVTALIFIVVGLIYPGFSRGGVVAYIVGADNRLSTSKTQVALWTVAIVFGFLFLTFQLFGVQDATSITNSLKHFAPEYLLLLGGPFAAAVLAKSATTTKTGEGTVQQVTAAAPSLGDVVSDHNGQTSMSDTQFFAFNAVSLAYFGVALARTSTALPPLPSTLVGLTSVSALMYMGNKMVASNKATISSVSIFSISSNGFLHAGDQIRIVGNNFYPPGTAPEDRGKNVAVLFDGVEVKPQGLTDDQMVATAPAGIAERDGTGVTISVRTSTGTQTAAATQLTAQAPKISSVQRADDVLTIHGYGLRSADGTQPGIVVKDSTGSVLQVQPMTREQMTHLAMSGAISVALRQAPAKPPVSVSILINGAVTAEATSSN